MGSTIRAVLCAFIAAAIALFVLWPVGLVFQSAWQGTGSAEPGLTLAPKQVSLAVETLKLVVLVLFVALPIGVTGALLVFRCDTPARWLWRLLILLPALVPIDLHATAWLATAGPQGLTKALGLPVELAGIFGAAWVHAMAAIPWVVAVVGPGLCIVEAELEEDCLLLVGTAGTIWRVTLRRASGAIVAAALIVSVQAAGEMAVTDLLQVRTYAETVYTEFAIEGRVGAATATAVPGVFVWLVLVAIAGALLVRTVPAHHQAIVGRRPLFQLGRARWAAAAGCICVISATLAVPTFSLVWRAGLKFPRILANQVEMTTPAQVPDSTALTSPQRIPPHWSVRGLVENVGRSAESAGDQLELSVIVAICTAAVTVPLAWIAVVAADRGRAGQCLLAAVTCALFALPGPVVGIGLKLAIGRPFLWWGADPTTLGGTLANWMDQFGRTLGVLVWLHTLRAFPFAVVALWPVRRMVNRRLVEAATIDGAGPWKRFRHIELPACRAALIAAALVSAVFSIGELGGSVIVTPPGQQPLSVRIFTFAHHGLESHLAGICLVLLGISTAGSLAVLLCVWWSMRQVRE